MCIFLFLYFCFWTGPPPPVYLFGSVTNELLTDFFLALLLTTRRCDFSLFAIPLWQRYMFHTPACKIWALKLKRSDFKPWNHFHRSKIVLKIKVWKKYNTCSFESSMSASKVSRSFVESLSCYKNGKLCDVGIRMVEHERVWAMFVIDILRPRADCIKFSTTF